TYEPDPNARSYTNIHAISWTGRATWQAAQKQKFNFGYEYNNVCTCNAVSATVSPEAAPLTYFGPKHNVAVDWASPVTNRLLLDGSFLFFNLYRVGRPEGTPTLTRVTEQSSNLSYRGLDVPETEATMIKYAYRFWASYITGTHAVKIGYNDSQATSRRFNYVMYPSIPSVSYRFNNGVPNQFTQFAEPSVGHSNIDHEMGIFVQDQWRWQRLTMSGGIRLDYFKTSFPEMHLGP